MFLTALLYQSCNIKTEIVNKNDFNHEIISIIKYIDLNIFYLQVTFDTIYNYKILKDSGVTDNQIESEIGNFDVFSEFLSTTSDLSLIFSAEDPDSFKFQGLNLLLKSFMILFNLLLWSNII